MIGQGHFGTLQPLFFPTEVFNISVLKDMLVAGNDLISSIDDLAILAAIDIISNSSAIQRVGIPVLNDLIWLCII